MSCVLRDFKVLDVFNVKKDMLLLHSMVVTFVKELKKVKKVVSTKI